MNLRTSLTSRPMQKPATGPYSTTLQKFFNAHFNFLIPSTSKLSIGLFLWDFRTKILHHLSSVHPFRPPCFNHTYDIKWVIKFFIYTLI
jgi:hypothetical protein